MLGRGMLLSAITVYGNTALALTAARQQLHSEIDGDDSTPLLPKDSVAARWTYNTSVNRAPASPP